MDSPKNFGALFDEGGNLVHTLVAGAASDNSEKTGAVVDRMGFGSGSILIPWAATCTDTKKLTVTVKRYQSADNSNWDAAETIKAATDLFTAAGAVVDGSGVVRIDEDWSSAKRYVKYSVTADLNAASTDTATYGLVVVKGGAVDLPAND